MPSATPRTPVFAHGTSSVYEALAQPPRNPGNSEELSLLEQHDVEDFTTTEDEDVTFDNVVSERRLKVRFGMVLTAVALLVAAVSVVKWSSERGGVQHTSPQIQQQTVAKFVDPCAPATIAPAPANPCAQAPAPVTTTAPSDLCSPFTGLLFGSSACCFPACGAFCGHANCQMSPLGPGNCCTKTFTHLCGSTKAPCLLPKTINGAAQLLTELANFGTPANVAAVALALSRALGVPVKDITAHHQTGATGRRLTTQVNVNYVLRLHQNSTITAATVTAKSPAFLTEVQPLLATQGVTVTAAALPTPVENAPGVNQDKKSTTVKFPFLPIPASTTGAEPEPELS